MKSLYFNRNTQDYLINSFKKVKFFVNCFYIYELIQFTTVLNTLNKQANLNEENVTNLFEWLSKSPKWTTIRVNKLKIDSNESLNYVQNFVNDVIKIIIMIDINLSV